MSPPLIRDYIQVKRQPTVVRLSELETANSAWISDGFYLSEAIQSHLNVLRVHLSQPHGTGIFLIGHYGSGKSHFLAFLTQQLAMGKLGSEAPKPYPISLLNHKASEPLERIVERELGLEGSGVSRPSIWNNIDTRFPNGLFLLIDELSEFLRSKNSPQAFNEDIRFLQFLGEWAQAHRLWVLGAMQEAIETTGAIESDLYRKIKDRFPVRLQLSPTHLKEFIQQGLMLRKPGFESAVDEWARTVKTSFSTVRLEMGDLCQSYPLHPVVFELLEEIRDQFSQTRGAVGFIVGQLLGDDSREAAPFLDRPFGELLTADKIVDHFQDLLELQPQFQGLAQKVFPFYRKEMPQLFPNPAQQGLAWKVLHLLILVHLSPRRQVLTAKDATWWLLHRLSRIDPDKNEQCLRQILDKLTEDGAFIQKRGSGFFLNLTDESRDTLDRLLVKAVKELKPRNESIFDLLIPLLEETPFNPFSLKPGTWQSFSVRWRFHERTLLAFLGGGEIERKPDDTLSLQVGLPWGPPPSHGPAVTPRPIELSQEIFELAALVSLRERPLNDTVRKRVDQMLVSRKPIFFQQVLLAYEQATLSFPDEYRELIRFVDRPKNFQDWLSRSAEKLLKRRYPQFERYAPSYGPLPAVGYQQWMEYTQNHDIHDASTDAMPEYVKVIREAYLVPMGLLQRKGNGYQTPSNLSRHDLVGVVMQLLPHEPSPQAVYDHLAEPVFGLVPDQVHVLLTFLYLEGEIEISKGGRTYRECFYDLPLPIQYDRLTAGRGLSQEQLHVLEKISEGLGIETPSRWGVMAQRRMGERLQKFAREAKAKLCAFLLRLNADETSDLESLRLEVSELVTLWTALEKESDPLRALQQFLYEVGSAGKLLVAHEKMASLPEKFESLSRETQRLSHLLSHTAVETCSSDKVQLALSALDKLPPITEPESVSRWIERAKHCYQDYCQFYEENHRIFWETVGKHPIWASNMPRIAYCSGLGLSHKLESLSRLRGEAQRERCLRATSLEFQPYCNCGFLAGKAPRLPSLEEWEGIHAEAQSELQCYFQQGTVKDKIRQWLDKDPPTDSKNWQAVHDYVEGKSLFPDLDKIDLIEQHLSGIETYQTVECRKVIDFFLGKTWERETLKREFAGWLTHLSPRIRFLEPPHREDKNAESNRFLGWMARQALETGTSLPSGISRVQSDILSDCLEPSWIKEAGLRNLEGLGLGEKSTDNILKWLFSGELPSIRLDCIQESPLCRLVGWARQGIDFSALEDWIRAVGLAYLNHRKCLRAAGETWLAFLEDLANKKMRASPSLIELLKAEQAAQWVCVDAMGVAILEDALAVIQRSLSAWDLGSIQFGNVQGPTQTDTFYRGLIEAGFKKPLEKINCIDELIHSERSYEDVISKIPGALEVALRPLAKRLDPSQEILIFSDHGFRIHRDGKSLCHGGASLLERTVPVIKLKARRG